MNSLRCAQCSLLNFTVSDVCKRCGAPLNPAPEGEGAFQQQGGFENYSDQTAYNATASGYFGQNQNYYGGLTAARPPQRKGKSTLTVLLALLALVALLGIPVYLKNRSDARFANLQWREYNSDDSSYTVLMPGAPKVENEQMNTPAGPVKMNGARVDIDKDAIFGVMYFEYPTVAPNVPVDMLFDKGLESMTSRTDVTVLSRKNITLNGNPGVEVEIKPPASANRDHDKGVLRLYWVAPRLYIVLTGGPDSTEASTARTKFLDSFKLNRNR